MVRWVVGAISRSSQCNKGRGMCYPVCGLMHITEPLLLIGKISPCGGSGFPLSLSEWFFTICLTSYNLVYFTHSSFVVMFVLISI